MKKRALLSLALILALLAALYLWYTRPRSFLAITGTSENAVCSAALLLLESWVDDGQAGQDIWELQDLSPGTPAFDALLPLLEKSRWRASLKNLLGLDAMAFCFRYIFPDCFAVCKLLGLEGNEGVFFTAVDTGQLRLSLPSSPHSLLFTAADGSTYQALAEYLKEYGTFRE